MVDFQVNAIQERLTNHSAQVAQDVQKAQYRQNAQTVQQSEAAQSMRAEESQPAEPEKVKRTVDEMNGVMKSLNRDLRFSFEGDGSGKHMQVSVVDAATGKVMRTYPSEEFVQMKEAIANNIGLIFNQAG